MSKPPAAKPKPRNQDKKLPQKADSLAHARRKDGETGEGAETMQLAASPDAAGGLHAEMVRRYADTICDDLDALQKAETTYTTKTGEVHRKPEWSIRLKALELKMAYIVGRPIERQQIIHSEQPMSLDDLMAEAKRSPAYLQTLLDMLETIKRHQQGQG